MRVNPPIHRSFNGLDLKYVWPGGLLLKEAMDVAIEIKNELGLLLAVVTDPNYRHQRLYRVVQVPEVTE